MVESGPSVCAAGADVDGFVFWLSLVASDDFVSCKVVKVVHSCDHAVPGPVDWFRGCLSVGLWCGGCV